MADEEKGESWIDRNKVVERYRANVKYGWMHLVIGENRETKRRFIRLLKYMNWFSIPNPSYLAVVQAMLKKGAEELGWEYDLSKEAKISITKESPKNVVYEKPTTDTVSVPDEIIEFIKNHPRAANRLIQLLEIDKLDEEDFSYIAELFSVLNEKVLSAGKRFKVSFQELFKKLSDADYKGFDELSEMMDKWTLTQIMALMQIVKKRLDDIDMFEEMIHNEKTYEINSDKSVHRVLEKSMWLLNDEYWIVQSNKSLRTFIGNAIETEYKLKRPDFVCVNQGDKLVILEIKRPSITLGKEELDQAELYQRIIKRHKGTSYKSVNIILVGNTISDEGRELEDLRKNIELMTYQDLLDGCRQRYQEYLRIVEG